MKVKEFNPIIGLEVHVELKTKSKMFCGCSADYFGKKTNTHTCPVCLGLPGALPFPNKKAIEWCVMIGLALNCKIPLFSKFDRKNYFYPDLPKGYQISQYDQPFCKKGFIEISNGKKIGITRVHMEEDTAKLVHQNTEGYSLIDFNRSGVPLVEIVTEPDFENARQVIEYLKKLQQIVRYLDVSNADMERGEMRLEPNISLRESNTTNKQILPIYKVEVKNINSFRFVEKAIDYEIERQKSILESGKTPAQETMGWNEKKQTTVTQRVKEEAMDYRYFPEPDVPPIRWSQSQISNLKSQIPEMPWEKEKKFIAFGLSPYNAQVSTATVERANFIEQAMQDSMQQKVDPRGTANFILNKLINNIDSITPAEAVSEYKKYSTFETINESDLEAIINNVVAENQKAVEDYKNGKIQVIGFLIGEVRQRFPKGDTNQIKTALEKYLKN